MKFTPRPLKENVNISSTSPLRELFVLLGGILGGIILIYIMLGFTLDILVDKVPDRLEETVGNFFSRGYSFKEASSPAEIKVQKLLDNLARLLPGKDLRFTPLEKATDFNRGSLLETNGGLESPLVQTVSERSSLTGFTVHIYDSPEVNAVALPGGHILIFSGLLEEIESENELSMILAHELGHFVYRDHLRGLGRGMVLAFVSSVLFGVDSSVANFSRRMLLTAEFKFSRRQEVTADIFALGLLSKRYGHVAGAYDFFERVKTKKNLPVFAKFLSTHPYPPDRIRVLKEETKRKGYLVKKKILLRINERKAFTD